MAAELALPFQPVDDRSEEHAWILAAQNGDRAAFGRLYEQYMRMVHGIALAYLPYSEAPDLVQDVFVLAMERLPTLRETGAFGGWLRTMARNAAVDRVRSTRRTVELAEAEAAALRTRDATGNSSYAAAVSVLARIQTLPEAYRETLVLRLVEGLTGPEIARLTGLTPDSVRVNLHRGMKLLRKELRDWQ
jgi:RNA polymerase sigma-70 factor (ECF subfamily)